MEERDWDYFRELEGKLAKINHELARLHESNDNLQKLNGFILSALLAEIIMLVVEAMK